MQRIVSGEGIYDLSKNIRSSDQENTEATTNLLRNNSEEIQATMSHLPSILLHANLVENEGDNGDLTMKMDNPSFGSESRLPGSPLETQYQKEEDRNISERRYSGSSPFSIPSNNGNSNRSEKKKCSVTYMTGEQQRQTPLSIISGLFPNVGVVPIARNDSRNSGTTTSLGSGLQRSQNSSRDWGWFEDVHHSDQSVSGSTTLGGVTIGSTRIGANDNNERKNTGGSIASSGTTRTSLPQHKLTSRADNTMYHNGISTNNNRIVTASIGGPNSRTIKKLDNNNHYDSNEGGEENANDSKNNRNDRLRARDSGGTNINTTSLLPTGDEMLIDEMQEYLEPIIINPRPRDMENAAIQAVTAPNYVLEESLSDQLLWKNTAGNRPPQPVEERAFFEAQWAENFAMSEVEYRMPAEVLTATTPASLNPFADGNFGTDGTGVIGGGGTPVADVGGARIGGGNHHVVADIVSSFVVPGGTGGLGVSSGQQNPHHQSRHRVVRSSSGSGGDLIVYAKGDNVFGTTVSKSFARPSINGELVSGVDTVNISIASYRVVESEKRGKHAQFLVIYREGSIRDTIGVWKRYSDFQELSKKVTKVHEGCASVIANMSPLAMTEDYDVEHLPNAITSWHLLKKRKRWYRCLDSGYLSLKAFLLERFLHDILFESSTPNLLRDFVGVPPLR